MLNLSISLPVWKKQYQYEQATSLHNHVQPIPFLLREHDNGSVFKLHIIQVYKSKGWFHCGYFASFEWTVTAEC